MANRTGIPQHELSSKFTLDEINEIFAARKIDFEACSKEDVRMQSAIFYICHSVRAAMGGIKAVSGMKPEHFEFRWGSKKIHQQSNEDIQNGLIALRGLWRRKEN